MEVLELTIENHGLFALHNMPCAVCQEKKAVFHCNSGIFEPCWTCQDKGFQIHKTNNKLAKKFIRRWELSIWGYR